MKPKLNFDKESLSYEKVKWRTTSLFAWLHEAQGRCTLSELVQRLGIYV